MYGMITQGEFDYIGILYLQTGLFELYFKSSAVRFPALRERVLYVDCVKYVSENFVAETEKEQFLKASSLDQVLASLKAAGTCESSYLRTENGHQTRHQLRYRWLDKTAGEVLVTRSDVTSAYEQEQRQLLAVREALKRAESANAAKSEFLSRMSHDMRTPLNGIIGMTYLTEKVSLPREIRENLHKIDSSSRFLLGLINDVLDMSKAESGKIELHPEPYTIEEFSQYIDAVIRPLCESKGQTLIARYGMPDGCAPLVDKLRMNQIVFNLLSNAVKYSPEGSKICYQDISVFLPDGRLRNRIEVTDHGVGMSESFQEVLFEPFSQENRVDNSEMRGTGLGLAITKKLVDAMGGTISVKSRVGEGTSVFVEIDFDSAPAPRVKNGTVSAELHGADSLKGMHLLLCEDHPLNQEIAKELLSEQGALISIAEDGAAGVRAFRESSVGYFDCILMDIRMPVLNGYEATKKIRSLARPDAKTVPILAMTADAFEDDVQKCLAAGMNGHIAKPIDPAELCRSVLRTVRGAGGPEEE